MIKRYPIGAAFTAKRPVKLAAPGSNLSIKLCLCRPRLAPPLQLHCISPYLCMQRRSRRPIQGLCRYFFRINRPECPSAESNAYAYLKIILFSPTAPFSMKFLFCLGQRFEYVLPALCLEKDTVHNCPLDCCRIF